MKHELYKIVYEALNKIDNEINEPTPDTSIFESGIDSYKLVQLVMYIEEAVDELYEKEITLVSEKAMSKRNSPFKNVRSLVDFIEESMNETC